jgi:hypothetical protein
MNAARRTGNWTPEGKAERAALRRDYLELTPAKRAEQVFESRGSCPRWQRRDAAGAVVELDIRGILGELVKDGVEFLVIGVPKLRAPTNSRARSCPTHSIPRRSPSAATGYY